uniref:FoP_duplication domain-containing protein n=1 Tax=Syphacia muris TaxID=451379 RepID=A0A0N5A811_9BILA
MDIVPSRIVLMGTSKMSLHDRFSKISRPKLAVESHLTNYLSADHDYREGQKVKPLVYDENLQDLIPAEYIYPDDLLDENQDPVEYRMVRPRQRYVRLSSSLRNRVNFPVRRSSTFYYPLSTGINRKALFLKPKSWKFLAVNGNVDVQSNGRNGKFNQSNSGFRPKRNMNFGRGKRFRSRRNEGNKFKREPVTREKLDKELDDYMKKGKHPQIDVSDLV